MIEFKSKLFHNSDEVCCYCDETISGGEVSRVAELWPLASGGGGVYFDVRSCFCQPCLRDLAIRANEVADQIQRNIDYHARCETERIAANH